MGQDMMNEAKVSVIEKEEGEPCRQFSTMLVDSL